MRISERLAKSYIIDLLSNQQKISTLRDEIAKGVDVPIGVINQWRVDLNDLKSEQTQLQGDMIYLMTGQGK